MEKDNNMKNIVKLFGFILLLTMLMAACAPAAKPTKDPVIPMQYSVTETDQGKTFTLHAGDSLAIVLDSNPSTGYSWVVKSVDNPVLSMDGEPVLKSDSSQLGAPGKTTITFTTVHTGSQALTLLYQRPFEKDAQPLKTFSINVTVAN
jgi:inhibitor of cysteine peptidase